MLTPKEKRNVLKAAGDIADGRGRFSCIQLAVNHSIELAVRFANFYGKHEYSHWFAAESKYSADEGRDCRVLLLLTFAEIG